MGTLLWETLPKIHYSFGNRSSIHCGRENNGEFLVAEPRSPTQVIPKPRSGKNPEMFLIVSNHYDASEDNIKVPLVSLFGVASVRAERSFTTKIVHDFLISVPTRPVCLSLPDVFLCLLILSFLPCVISVRKRLWLPLRYFFRASHQIPLCLGSVPYLD